LCGGVAYLGDLPLSSIQIRDSGIEIPTPAFEPRARNPRRKVGSDGLEALQLLTLSGMSVEECAGGRNYRG
jgi:hypothetical protein